MSENRNIQIIKISPDRCFSCNVCGSRGQQVKLVEICFFNRNNQGNCITLCDKCLNKLRTLIDQEQGDDSNEDTL